MTTDKPTEFDVEAYIAGAPDRSPRFTESDLRIVAERVASSMTDEIAEKDAEIERLTGLLNDVVRVAGTRRKDGSYRIAWYSTDETVEAIR